jgi:hypothetical protein
VPEKHHQQCLEAFLLIITDQQHHFLKYRKLVPDENNYATAFEKHAASN